MKERVASSAIVPFLRKSKYDVAWAATPTAVGILAANSMRQLVKAGHYVAGLSDIHSLVLHNRKLSCPGKPKLLRDTITAAASQIFGRLLRPSEAKLLSTFSAITMQSTKEREWLNHQRLDLATKSFVITNGVDEQCLAAHPSARNRRVLFFASFDGIYTKRLTWFLDNVWKALLQNFPRAKLTVAGKNLPASIAARLSSLNGQYLPWVPNLRELYESHGISVAPVFKGYGVINKVLEAMASGHVVIGDETAFNAIRGFRPTTHGLVANDCTAFINNLRRILSSDNNAYTQMRIEAKNLISSHHRWRNTYQSISEMLEAIYQQQPLP